MKIATILDQVDLGAIALPEFQRGYVWNRDQVKGLMHSLYRKHPVGSLLVWVTKTDNAQARGDGELQPGTVKLLLDGQQRITSLYGIVRGMSPKFFEGNEKAFSGLYFNLEEEVFEFYMPMKMKDNPAWINVTELMRIGAGEAIQKVVGQPEMSENLTVFINRLNAIDQIKGIDLHIEEVAGEDKTVDVVVDIFNRVNSGGTKLKKGDLALAKICAEWPQARDEMNTRLDKWRRAGYKFELEWLLRCVNTIITGEALFSALKDVDTDEFKIGLRTAEKHIDTLLNLISSRLGLDHYRVLGSRYSFPLMVRYLDDRGGTLSDSKERDKLLFWYIHTLLWGRYATSTESVLNQDLGLIEKKEGALERLIENLRTSRGDLKLHPDDFRGWSLGARFYPLLYLMTRVCKTKDLETGIELSNHLLGNLNGLQVHHIFPKALLYKNEYPKAEVNAIANFTFLTQETNLKISARNPSEYLEQLAEKTPGAVESHWIPMDRELWKVENYLDFLAARRELLADAANAFLEGLFSGDIPESEKTMSVLDREMDDAPGGITSEEEEELLIECNEWVVGKGLPEGDFLYELADEETGDVVAVFDIAWPNGLQPGLSQPVALLINEGSDVIDAANKAGYRYFTCDDDFKNYVRHEIMADSDENPAHRPDGRGYGRAAVER